jgi:hypothetical protein
MLRKIFISLLAFFAFAFLAASHCSDDSSAPGKVSNAGAHSFAKITLQPGSDATEVNFNWHSSNDGNKKSFIRILHPDNSIIKTERGTSDSVSATKLRHKATVKGLQQGASYKYQVSNDSVNWSAAYDYKTVPAGTFKFAVVGDPQIAISMQDSGWATTVGKIVLEGAYFIVSAGDHVDTVEGNELEYDNFFAPDGLRNLPFAPAIGNHDAHCLFAEHFNLPNEQNSKPLECSSIGSEWSAANSDLGNYYYIYNRVLFIALNTSPYPSESSAGNYISAFDATIEAAKVANAGKYDWIIVHHHKSTQSVAIHASDADIQAYVDAGFEKLMAQHGVDLVFAGHDHIFVRNLDSKSPVYMTLSTAGGLKYYPALTDYANNQNYLYSQNELPEYTIVEVDDKAMTVTTKTITGKQVDFLTLPKRNL